MSVEKMPGKIGMSVWAGHAPPPFAVVNEVIEDVKKGARVRNGLEGVGPEAPMVVNEKGGKQSKVLGRFDLLPPRAIIEVAKVLEEGAIKYGEENWRQIGSRSHLNHAIQHIYAYLAHDVQDNHLEHVATRVLMALEMSILEEDGIDNEGYDPFVEAGD